MRVMTGEVAGPAALPWAAELGQGGRGAPPAPCHPATRLPHNLMLTHVSHPREPRKIRKERKMERMKRK